MALLSRCLPHKSLSLFSNSAAAGLASVVLMLQRGADLISLDGSLLYAGCCHIISHVGEDENSLAAQTQSQ